MPENDKNELWKIIARAVCPKRSRDCARCALRSNCVRRAKDAAERIKAVYLITPRGDCSIYAAAQLNDIPKEKVVASN